jgi:L-iditol 2-dehydrogenase
MKALVLTAPGTLVMEERPIPPRPRPDAILVRVRHAGVCGSDIHRAFGGGAYHYPLVMGHELSGVVQESFAGSRRAAGDRVAVYPLIACKHCPACGEGAYQQCEGYDYLGSRSDGGFAEYVWAPEENCIPVPDGVELLLAALAEPAAVALHGVRRLTVRGGETAALFGGGPIGILAAQWLRILGCARIFVVDVDGRKLALARELGFEAVDAREADPVNAIRELTGGRGVRLSVEACGLPVTYRQAVEVVARSGEVLFMGNIRGDFVLPEKEVSSLLRRELTIRGTWNSSITPGRTDDWSATLDAMQNALVVAPLVSDTPPLSEGPAILRRMAAGQAPLGRVVFAV